MSMRKIFYTLIAVLSLLSCEKVHEWPREGQEVDPTSISAEITVSCVIQMNIAATVTKDGASAQAAADGDAYHRRFIVRILEENRRSEDEVFEQSFFKEVADTSPLEFTAPLHSKKYRLLVWMDYVDRNSHGDLYYVTSEGLEAVHLPVAESYVGCSDFKDTQTGVFSIDLTGNTEWFQHIEIELPLERPMAKISFQATDFAEYAEKLKYEGSLDELAKEISVEVHYNGYLATGFNVATQKLNDTSTGYSFGAVPENIPGEGSAELGSDYVFVNGEESSLTVSVVIKDRSGNVINKVDGLNVPTYRGKETIVKAKFFTKDYVPGIGIDPRFDDEFVVYV